MINLVIKKEFLDYNIVRDNAFVLAKKIIDAKYVPDIIYTSMRGGAYLGNVISEMFNVFYKNEKTIRYSTVVAHSYSAVNTQSKIVLDGWTYPPENLSKDAKILLVDDIFDSGETINFLVKDLLKKGLSRLNIKVVVHDYKRRHNKNIKLDVTPDWYARVHDIYEDKDDIWIHYMSHELVGLTNEELEEHYFKKNPKLKDVFKEIKC